MKKKLKLAALISCWLFCASSVVSKYEIRRIEAKPAVTIFAAKIIKNLFNNFTGRETDPFNFVNNGY